jgi:hypothetical protein
MFNTPVTMEAFPASIMEDDNPSLREVSGRREAAPKEPETTAQRSWTPESAVFPPLQHYCEIGIGTERCVFNRYAGSITMVIESK